MTAVERYEALPIPDKWEYVSRLAAAEDLLPGSFYGQVKNQQTGMMERRVLPGKLFLVVEYGAMLGLPPMAAIQGVHVIEGKPSLSAETMLSLVRQAGHRIRIRRSGTVEGGDFQATVILTRKDDPDEEISATWTPHRALRADLLDSYTLNPQTKLWDIRRRSKNGNRLNWETYPENMCTWRAVSEVCRLGAGDVFNGMAYTPEELSSGVTPEDDEIEAEFVDERIALVESAANLDELDALFARFKADERGMTADLHAAVMRRGGYLGSQQPEPVTIVVERDTTEPEPDTTPAPVADPEQPEPVEHTMTEEEFEEAERRRYEAEHPTDA